MNGIDPIEAQKNLLIDQLMCVASELDETFRYHPDNPNQVDVVEQFKYLSEKKAEIENELNQLM